MPLRNLFKIENLEEECVSNKAVYHKRCRPKKGRKLTQILKTNQVPHEKNPIKLWCKEFSKHLHFMRWIDSREIILCYFVRDGQESLIVKLSEGDFVATESKYHKTCLAEFYYKVRTFVSRARTAEQEKSIVKDIVVAEIKRY